MFAPIVVAATVIAPFFFAVTVIAPIFVTVTFIAQFVAATVADPIVVAFVATVQSFPIWTRPSFQNSILLSVPRVPAMEIMRDASS